MGLASSDGHSATICPDGSLSSPTASQNVLLDAVLSIRLSMSPSSDSYGRKCVMKSGGCLILSFAEQTFAKPGTRCAMPRNYSQSSIFSEH
jgi:hypothetical protein